MRCMQAATIDQDLYTEPRGLFSPGSTDAHLLCSDFLNHFNVAPTAPLGCGLSKELIPSLVGWDAALISCPWLPPRPGDTA